MSSQTSRGSRSHGTRSHPCSHFVRFTDEENKKLTTLCRKRSLTVQAFLHAAAMRALNEATLGKKTDGEVARDEDRSRREREPVPRGLGIRDRLVQFSDDRRHRDDREDETFTPSMLPPSIPSTTPTIRVGLDDEVIALARTIVESPQSSRREVWKAACRVLARGRTQEEALQLADDLDAAVRRLDGVPQTALEKVRARLPR